MKLKNKRTGEIKDWDFGNWYQTILNPENKEKYECNLNDFIDRTVKFREEWEDYEEPKGIQCIYYVNHFDAAKLDGVIVGFDSKEEAKQALEKLKAWKRLKDNGFRVIDYGDEDIRYEIKDRYDGCLSDLETVLFGGEE